MAEMSNYLENALLNGTLNATTYTAPTTVYVSLWTTNPNDDASGAEVTGGSYARTAVSFATAVGTTGNVLNDAVVEFPAATAVWGTVGWIGINDCGIVIKNDRVALQGIAVAIGQLSVVSAGGEFCAVKVESDSLSLKDLGRIEVNDNVLDCRVVVK